MNKNIILICSWLIYLIPLALLTGPFLPDLFASIIGILTTFLIIKEKKYSYFNNNYFYFFITFYLCLILSTMFAESIFISLESSLFYFRFGLFAIGVWYLIENNKKIIRYFSIFLLVTFIFALLDGYYQVFNGPNIFGYDVGGVRLALTLNDKAILGGYLARLFPLLFAVLIYSFDLKKSYILLMLLILIFTDVLIFISGERTALGLLFLSTVFIIIFLSKYKKIRFLTFLVSLVIMTFLALYNPAIKERNIDHTLNQFYKDGSLTLFSKRHESHIGGAWNMFRESPLIGQGPKMFRVLCNDSRFNYNDDTCSTHPHNTYAQLAAETGILGLLFIFLLCFKVIKVVLEHGILYIRKQKYLLSDFQVCLIACLIVTLWPIIPSQNFFNNWINVIYYLPIGFLLFSIHEKRKNLDI